MQAAKKIDFISSKEAADMIGKTPEWMSAFGRKARKGPPWYAIGGTIKYDRDEVVRWINAHRRGG